MDNIQVHYFMTHFIIIINHSILIVHRHTVDIH